MTSLIQVQVNLVLSFLLLILLGHAQLKMNRKIETNKLFVMFMRLSLLLLVLEAASVLLNKTGQVSWVPYHKLVNVLGFAVTPFVAFIGYLFLKKWLNRFSKEKIGLNKLLLIPLAINGLTAVLSFDGGFLFHVTEANVYERGPYFFILPIVSYTLFVYNLYFVFKHRQRLQRSEMIVIIGFFLAPAIFTGMQLIYPSLLLTWNGVALVTVLFYIFILNDQSYRDNLTGLENRMAYEHYGHQMDTKKLKNTSLIFFDVDNLKSINDQHGHMAGDDALQTFAYLLRETFPLAKKNIRLGGDEFVVIQESKSVEKTRLSLENLIQLTSGYNHKSENPYSIEFSYGVVSYEDGEDLNALLKRADTLMYAQKKDRK